MKLDRNTQDKLKTPQQKDLLGDREEFIITCPALKISTEYPDRNHSISMFRTNYSVIDLEETPPKETGLILRGLSFGFLGKKFIKDREVDEN